MAEPTSTQLVVGEIYIRDRLRELFGITDATISNGIFHPKGTRSVWLFVTEAKTPDRVQYTDHLDGDVLLMQGQTEGRTDHFLTDQAVASVSWDYPKDRMLALQKQASQEMTRRNLNIQPTLTARPRLYMRVIVIRDLVLKPYQPLFFSRGSVQLTAKPGLRLGPLPKTEIVRLTFSCSAELKAQLDRYAAFHSRVYGVAADPVALIPLMLATFMAKDRAFSRARRSPVER